MRFIVEVPVYLKVEVDARDADEAKLAAQRSVNAELLPTDRIVSEEVVPLDPEEEDRDPDVYVCRGGKLTRVGEEGWLEPLDESC